MVLKGVYWVNNTKFRSYGFEMDQLGTICKSIIFKVTFEAKWYFSLKISYFSAFSCIFMKMCTFSCILRKMRAFSGKCVPKLQKLF